MQLSPAASRYLRLDWLVILIIAILGITRLPTPFHGDQALFTLGAMKINQGGVLYRDFWDVKQPGIYGFYWLAGRLFGYHEIGVHTFELIYAIGCAVILRSCTMVYYPSALARLAPLITIGIYYTNLGVWTMTQVEAIVGLPIFLTLWLTAQATENPRSQARLLFLSGVTAGITLMFKIAFLPILLAFWGLAVLNSCRRQPVLLTVLRTFLPIGLGLLTPITVLLLAFYRVGALSDLFYITLSEPSRILSELPLAPFNRFFSSFRWFVQNYIFMIFLGWVGAYWSLRQRQVFTQGLVAWVILGWGIILAQRFSWWTYHYLLLSVPIGLLALKGIESIEPHFRVMLKRWGCKNTIITALGLTLIFAPNALALSKNIALLGDYNFALNTVDRLNYQAAHVANGYGVVIQDVALLQMPDRRAGDIYVFGATPVYYLLSGRAQASKIAGWTPEIILPDRLHELAFELENRRAPYIFVLHSYVNHLQDFGEFGRLISTQYHCIHQGPTGNWYELGTLAQDKEVESL